MNKLIIVLLLLNICADAFAYGQCIAQLRPFCNYGSHPVCVDAGYTNQDYYVCIRD